MSNQNDSKAMGDKVKRTTEILVTTDFVTLYDKRYHTGYELKTVFDLGVDAWVAIIETSSYASNLKFNISELCKHPILSTNQK